VFVLFERGENLLQNEIRNRVGKLEFTRQKIDFPERGLALKG